MDILLFILTNQFLGKLNRGNKAVKRLSEKLLYWLKCFTSECWTTVVGGPFQCHSLDAREKVEEIFIILYSFVNYAFSRN